ncbi:MAG: hypothetical protein AAF797_14460 [Planctomycetota bacterium]
MATPPLHPLASLVVAVCFTLIGAVAHAEDHADLLANPSDWRLEPAESWRWSQADGDATRNVLTLHRPGPPKTQPVRRIASIALYEPAVWSQATLDLEVRSLEPAARKGADVCIVLGYRDDTHYIYIHLSNDADGRTHNVIMQVDGDTRRVIHTPAHPEPRLGEGWQRVRVVFDDAGRIAVYMDDLEAPLMTAETGRPLTGRIGVGSFNDRAAFAGFTVTGERVDTQPKTR